MQKATDKLPEVELNLGFEYIIYYKQDRKKKVFKLHGKPFIRLKLFLLATEAFNTCNQKKVNQKAISYSF